LLNCAIVLCFIKKNAKFHAKVLFIQNNRGTSFTFVLPVFHNKSFSSVLNINKVISKKENFAA